MDRVKINMPKEFGFTTSLPIRISDVNYGGHVGNDSFLALIQEARLHFFKQFDYTEIDFEGCSTIMVDAAIEFKGELFYGDVVDISVAANNFTKLGFDLFYLLEKEVNNKKILIGKAKTGILCFDYTLRKLTSVPEKAIEKLNRKEN